LPSNSRHDNTVSLNLRDDGTTSIANSSIQHLSVTLSDADTNFTGSAQDDSIDGSSGSYVIHGGDGKDYIRADSNSYSLDGERPSYGDQLYGDDGDDMITIANASFFLVDGGSGTGGA